MHGAAIRTGSRYSTARQMTKPAVVCTPYIPWKRMAKPTSAPPAPPGSGTALMRSSSMDPEARQIMKSAGSPKERSTNHGSAYMQPSCSSVTSIVSSISRTFLAERLKAAENLTTWVFTTS